jgi:hypothetical protein
VNDHKYDGARLSKEQKELRKFYSRLINLVGEPAFADGNFFSLNRANCDNEHFGRLPDEQASGHWLYAFLRYEVVSGQRFLVVANLHPDVALRDIIILLPNDALRFLDLQTGGTVTLRDRLSEEPVETNATFDDASVATIPLANISPLSACYFEFGTKAWLAAP